MRDRIWRKYLIDRKYLLGVLFLVFPWLGQAQNSMRGDCRLDYSTLKPVIARFNPYFSDHKWDPKTRMELARLDRDRLVVITQDGCKRHHIKISLILNPGPVENTTEFWVREVKGMMTKIFLDRRDYREFGPEFDKNLEQKVPEYGLNNSFNFPVGTRNFICNLRYHPVHGAKLTIEMISFLFREEVRPATISEP